MSRAFTGSVTSPSSPSTASVIPMRAHSPGSLRCEKSGRGLSVMAASLSRKVDLPVSVNAMPAE